MPANTAISNLVIKITANSREAIQGLKTLESQVATSAQNLQKQSSKAILGEQVRAQETRRRMVVSQAEFEYKQGLKTSSQVKAALAAEMRDYEQFSEKWNAISRKIAQVEAQEARKSAAEVRRAAQASTLGARQDAAEKTKQKAILAEQEQGQNLRRRMLVSQSEFEYKQGIKSAEQVKAMLSAELREYKEFSSQWTAISRKIAQVDAEEARRDSAAHRAQTTNARKSDGLGSQRVEAVGRVSDGLLMGGGITAGALGYAAEQAARFNSQMVEARNNTQMSDEEFKVFQSTALNLGKTTGAAVDQIGQAFMRAKNHGLDMKETLAVVNAATKSAVATGSDVGETANVLAQTMHIFHLNGDQAAETMNTLHQASLQGNMTMSELVEHFGLAEAVTSKYGLTLQDTAAAFATMTENGLDAAQAGTQVRDAMQHITNPGKAAREEIQRLSHATGVDLVGDIQALQHGTGSLTKFMIDLNQATHGQAVEINKIIPAQRGAFGAMALTGKAAIDLKRNYDQLVLTQSGKLDPTTQGFNRTLGTLDNQVARVNNTLLEMYVKVGPALIPMLQQAAKGVGELADDFNKLSPDTQQAITKMLVFGGATLIAVGALGKIYTALKGAAEMFGLFKGAAVAAEGAEAATAAEGVTAFAAGGPWGLAIGAAILLIGGIAIAWKNASDAQDKYAQKKLDAANATNTGDTRTNIQAQIGQNSAEIARQQALLEQMKANPKSVFVPRNPSQGNFEDRVVTAGGPEMAASKNDGVNRGKYEAMLAQNIANLKASNEALSRDTSGMSDLSNARRNLKAQIDNANTSVSKIEARIAFLDKILSERSNNTRQTAAKTKAGDEKAKLLADKAALEADRKKNVSALYQTNKAAEAEEKKGFGAGTSLSYAISKIDPESIKTTLSESCAEYVSKYFRKAGMQIDVTPMARDLRKKVLDMGGQSHEGPALPGDLVVYHGGRMGTKGGGNYHVAVANGPDSDWESSRGVTKHESISGNMAWSGPGTTVEYITPAGKVSAAAAANAAKDQPFKGGVHHFPVDPKTAEAEAKKLASENADAVTVTARATLEAMKAKFQDNLDALKQSSENDGEGWTPAHRASAMRTLHSEAGTILSLSNADAASSLAQDPKNPAAKAQFKADLAQNKRDQVALIQDITDAQDKATADALKKAEEAAKKKREYARQGLEVIKSQQELALKGLGYDRDAAKTDAERARIDDIIQGKKQEIAITQFRLDQQSDEHAVRAAANANLQDAFAALYSEQMKRGQEFAENAAQRQITLLHSQADATDDLVAKNALLYQAEEKLKLITSPDDLPQVSFDIDAERNKRAIGIGEQGANTALMQALYAPNHAGAAQGLSDYTVNNRLADARRDPSALGKSSARQVQELIEAAGAAKEDNPEHPSLGYDDIAPLIGPLLAQAKTSGDVKSVADIQKEFIEFYKSVNKDILDDAEKNPKKRTGDFAELERLLAKSAANGGLPPELAAAIHGFLLDAKKKDNNAKPGSDDWSSYSRDMTKSLGDAASEASKTLLTKLLSGGKDKKAAYKQFWGSLAEEGKGALIKLFQDRVLNRAFSSIFDGIGDKLASALKGGGSGLVQSATQFALIVGAAMNLTSPNKKKRNHSIFGAVLGGIAGSFFGSAGMGAEIGANLGGMFAGGGRPPVGVPSIIGEKGAELWVPDVAGTIIPNNRMASIMSAGTYSPGAMSGGSQSLTQRGEQVSNSPAQKNTVGTGAPVINLTSTHYGDIHSGIDVQNINNSLTQMLTDKIRM